MWPPSSKKQKTYRLIPLLKWQIGMSGRSLNGESVTLSGNNQSLGFPAAGLQEVNARIPSFQVKCK